MTTYKLQHMGLGGILDQAISICKDHFGLLFKIMLILYIPFYLLLNLGTLALTPRVPPANSFQEMMRNQQIQQEALGNYWAILALIGFASLIVIIPVTNAAVIQAVARIYLGEPVTALEAVKHGFNRLGPLIWTSFLMMAAIYGGILLCIIPGIYFAIWFGLSQHVVVLEGLNGPKALGRSRKLVHKDRGKFLALVFIMTVISLAITWGAMLIPQPHLQAVVSTLLQAVATILWTAAGVVFYFSARCGVENFDLHYLANAIGENPATVDAGMPPIQ